MGINRNLLGPNNYLQGDDNTKEGFKHLVDLLIYPIAITHITITKLHMKWTKVVHWIVFHLTTIITPL
jgi:hypothetical protein